MDTLVLGIQTHGLCEEESFLGQHWGVHPLQMPLKDTYLPIA